MSSSEKRCCSSLRDACQMDASVERAKFIPAYRLVDTGSSSSSPTSRRLSHHQDVRLRGRSLRRKGVVTEAISTRRRPSCCLSQLCTQSTRQWISSISSMAQHQTRDICCSYQTVDFALDLINFYCNSEFQTRARLTNVTRNVGLSLQAIFKNSPRFSVHIKLGMYA